LNLSLVALSGLTNGQTVSRASPLTITWTGGSATGTAAISLLSYGSNLSSETSAYCTAPANAGTFTVPVSVLQLLPTGGTFDGIPFPGSISLSVGATGTFTAPLTLGGQIASGYTSWTVEDFRSVTWQ
jgi:hypothetical protein